jgi:hypothetical protein
MWKRHRLAIRVRARKVLVKSIKPIVVKGVKRFIRYAWLLLAVIAIQALLSPFLLWIFRAGAFWTCVLESAYTIMGDPPFILHAKLDEYRLFDLLVLFCLRLSGWLLLPILLSIIFEEGKEGIDAEYQKQAALAEERSQVSLQLLEEAEAKLKKQMEEMGIEDDVDRFDA